MGYKHIMIAIDLNSDASYLLKKSEHITKGNKGSVLSVIHVDINVSEFYQGMLPADLSSYDIQKHHRSISKMKKMIDTLDIPIYKHLLFTGSIEDEVYRSVLENDVDLLILGHHKSNIISGFFSPTAPIVRSMPCDILLLKLK